MASDEMRKKWGTIFMGDREASVEQLNAMRERVDHERLQKERAEDYMERVRARAADRAREILGEAYTERQKVLEEARGEAAVQKRAAAQECAKIKAEGEALRARAQDELEKAQAEREEAEKIRGAAKEEGYQDGMRQAGVELQEFRGELGQSMASLMRAIERQRKEILDNWREDIVGLTQAAVEAGTGMVLQKEHDAILRALVNKSLDLLESRGAIACRVNPRDEETVSDLFRAARERYPELRQWTVSGDDAIEPGGMVVESGTGSVDLRRANFREMVQGILEHLGLPEDEREEEQAQAMAHLVEKEVAHIASLTPEPDQPAASGPELAEIVQPEAEEQAEPAQEASLPAQEAGLPAEAEMPPAEDVVEEAPAPMASAEPERQPETALAEQGEVDPSLAELEEELFPLGEGDDAALPAGEKPAAPKAEAAPAKAPEAKLDSKILSEGGFL